MYFFGPYKSERKIEESKQYERKREESKQYERKRDESKQYERKTDNEIKKGLRVTSFILTVSIDERFRTN